MVTDKIKGIRRVCIPLVLTYFPVCATLRDIGFSNQGVFRHFSSTSIHGPSAAWIWSKFAHLINDDSIVVQHNNVIAIEPRYLTYQIACLKQLWRRQCIHKNENTVGFDYTRKFLNIGRFGSAIVPSLHAVTRQVNRHR